jgi:hypothetical protein
MNLKLSMRLKLFGLALLVLSLWNAANAQSYPPAWSSANHYAVGDQAQVSGNVVRCISPVTPGGFKYSQWELWQVRANTTLLVGPGQTFPILTTAWAYAQNARIAGGVYLHIYFDSVKGNISENISAPFSLDHPSGGQISLIGDHPQNIVMNFTGSSGFTLDSGHSISSIQNITVSGVAGIDGNNNGLYVSSNATIGSVSGVTIEGFGTGVYADTGGYVSCAANLSCSGVGIAAHARSGGQVVFGVGWTYQGNAGGKGESTYCFIAEFYGQIHAIEANISENASANVEVWATHGGIVDISYSTITHTAGIRADNDGYIDFSNGTISDSGSDKDLTVSDGGHILAAYSTYTTSSVGTADDSKIFGS